MASDEVSTPLGSQALHGVGDSLIITVVAVLVTCKMTEWKR